MAALGLRVRLAELTDELHTAIDAGLQVQSLHDIVGLWEANVGGLTFDELVEEGSPTPCEDCGVDVAPNSDDGRPVEGAWEWYMVRDPVWEVAMGQGRSARYLCIACLERRIGRPLRPHDFTDVPTNMCLSGLESPRLRALLEGHVA